MVNKIIFKGYKSFKETNELELKPITVLIGKNSAGKSAVVKLPTLIEASLSGDLDVPFTYVNDGVELGAEYRDLFYERRFQERMTLKLFTDSNELEIDIINSTEGEPIITQWTSIDTSQNIKKVITSKEIEDSDIDLFNGLLYKNNLDTLKTQFQLITDYIGPFRLIPSRIFNLTGKSKYKKIGIRGENAYQLLAIDEELVAKVSKWYENNFDGWELNVNKVESYYEIRIKRKDSRDVGVNIVDVGQGMSQALPIIVKAHLEHSDPVLNILEQPELHLHPAAHGNLAELLVDSIKKSKSKYLIETHSKNFILRLRRLIAEKKIDSSLINLYWVHYDEIDACSSLRKITINEVGEVDSWPENIFNESFEETLALRKAQKS